MEKNHAVSNQDYLYMSIGKIVVHFQFLERCIEQLIFSCTTSSHEQTRILMSEMSFKSKMHVMKTLIKELHKPDDAIHDGRNIFETIDSIFKRCAESEQIRNTLVHSFWITEFRKAPNLVMRMKENAKSKKGFNLAVESVSSGSLDEEIRKIETCLEEIQDFSRKLSTDYNRLHGISGLEKIVDHQKISNFLYMDFLGEHSNEL